MSGFNVIKTFAKLDKNPSEKIHVSLCEVSGRKMADVRIYYTKDMTWLPTKKGVCFDIELLPDLSAALKAIADAVEA